ncbi:MAG: AmiS/UreI family transporter [Olegusella sp.]|nr:AmiS/UreI family transporter [Olegusella sp.]
MLGVVLLYVGIVLISNGANGVLGIEDKSSAVMNIFTGGLGVVCNFAVIIYGACTGQGPWWFYGCATGLLFAFTYLYSAINTIFELDQRLYGIFSLFVAINSIPCGILSWINYAGKAGFVGMFGPLYGIIWWLWGLLWLTGFLGSTLGKDLGKFPSYLGIVEGVVTAWIPGFLMLTGIWPL